MKDYYRIVVKSGHLYVTWDKGLAYFYYGTETEDNLLSVSFMVEKLNTAYLRGKADGFEEAERHFNVGRAAKGLLD